MKPQSNAPFARWQGLHDSIVDWAELHRIRVEAASLAPGKAGEFDGRSVTMNSSYAAAEQAFYLIHALGTIVAWSTNPSAAEQVFIDLDAAKARQDSVALREAVARYQAFEEQTSGHAIELLDRLAFPEVVGPYTNFMRADLESMKQFHLEGRAPVWRTFFDEWNRQVAAGGREVPPFRPSPVPQFQPVEFKMKEILQQQPR